MKVGDVYRVLNAREMGIDGEYKDGDLVEIIQIESSGAGKDNKENRFPSHWVGEYLEPYNETGLKPNMERFKRDVRNTLARWRTTNQVSGTHYSDLVVEPNDYAILNDLDPIQHNVIKYVTRAKSEDDLDKAISQIQRLKEYKFGRK